MKYLIGIDVSAARRGCAIGAIDESGRSVGCRWSCPDVAEVVNAVRQLARDGSQVSIGIGSPRNRALQATAK